MLLIGIPFGGRKETIDQINSRRTLIENTNKSSEIHKYIQTVYVVDNLVTDRIEKATILEIFPVVASIVSIPYCKCFYYKIRTSVLY